MCIGTQAGKAWVEGESCSGAVDTKEMETEARRCYGIPNTWESISNPKCQVPIKDPQAWLHGAYRGTPPGKPSMKNTGIPWPGVYPRCFSTGLQTRPRIQCACMNTGLRTVKDPGDI